jgi:hypothetical protein
MKKALIDPQQNNLVCQIEPQQFDVAPPLYWVDCPDDVVAGWTTYVNGVFSPVVIPEPTAEENEARAKKRLADSDFSVLPDVLLSNKAEWEAYRSALRQIATNPTDGNLTWPVKPQTIWG